MYSPEKKLEKTAEFAHLMNECARLMLDDCLTYNGLTKEKWREVRKWMCQFFVIALIYRFTCKVKEGN